MIDFAREQVIYVDALADRLGVSHVTVRRWFKRGLDYAKLGGVLYTSLEAVQRFSRQSDPVPSAESVVVDQATLAELRKSLKAKGIVFGSEARRVAELAKRKHTR